MKKIIVIKYLKAPQMGGWGVEKAATRNPVESMQYE
jgi:hypothetical protein